MGAQDLELADRFLEGLAAAAETGDRERVIPFLSDEIEWVTPKRTLRGIDEIRTELTWLRPPDNLEGDFETGEVRDLGNGRIAVDVHEVYRVSGSR